MMMMKKFLTFVVVLALASSASAVSISLVSGGASTLTLGTDVTVGQVITVDLISDTGCNGVNSIDFLNVGQTLGAIAGWQGTMALGIGSQNGTPTGNDIIRANANAQAGAEAGAGASLYQYTVTVGGLGTLTPVMGAYDWFSTLTGPPPYGYWYGPAITQNALHIVPEPVTIVLLGLGGLLLRRRK
jgi:hypothetical protein